MNIEARMGTSPGGVALAMHDHLSCEAHDTPGAIEAEWKQLDASGASTGFQRFGWVDAYVRNVGAAQDTQHRFVLGRIDGKAAFILPLALKRTSLGVVANWVGGTHSGYNFGLWSAEGAAAAVAIGARGFQKLLAQALPGVDAAILRQIPFEQDGFSQPLAMFPRLSSAVIGYSVDLEGGMEGVIARSGGGARRRRARSKERRMAETAPVSQRLLTDPEQIDEALTFFAREKALRLAEQGLPNVFGQPGVMDFFRELAHRSIGSREPLLQLSVFEVGGVPRAIIGSGIDRGRVNLYILTYSRDEMTPHSPGQVLMYRHIEECAAAGCKVFDFGVGYELYKESWADARVALFDAYLAFTARGAAITATTRLQDAAKNALRENETVRALMRRLQGTEKQPAETRE